MKFNKEKYKKWSDTSYRLDTKLVKDFKDTISPHKNILVIGDYDVDGIMSAYIMCTGLKRLFPDKTVNFILPRRFTDGYGISQSITDTVCKANKGKDLCIITVDNGISQFDAINAFKSEGFTVCVADHHSPAMENGSQLIPPADFIADLWINGKSDSEGFRDYCGAGLAYKLFEQLIDVSDLLPYAATATIADSVSLTEGNWKLCRTLLDDMADGNFPEKLNFFNKPIKYCDEEDIKFGLNPVLNAPGRLLDSGASDVLKYLFKPTEEKKKEFTSLNDERKKLVEEGMEQVEAYIKEHDLTKKTPIWVNIHGLHHGVIGIIAGRITEKYNRPCIICSDGKGSGRSVLGFNLFEYLTEHKEHLQKFGGHPLACGLSIDDLGFKHISRTAVNIESTRSRKYEFDFYLANKKAIPASLKFISQGKPYGEGNPVPKFCYYIQPDDPVRVMGKNKNCISIPDDGFKICAFSLENTVIENIHSYYGIGTLSMDYFKYTTKDKSTGEEKVVEKVEPALTLRNMYESEAPLDTYNGKKVPSIGKLKLPADMPLLYGHGTHR